MSLSPAPEMIVVIDDEIETLLKEIDAAPERAGKDELVEDMQRMLLDSVLGPFGLSAAMLEDVDGGNVTTLHNFQDGVTANEADRERHAGWRDGKYKRQDLDKNRPLGKPPVATDAYTGKEIAGNDVTVDHVRSVDSINSSAKSHLAQSQVEIQKTVNHPDNLVHTHGSINSSKGQRDPEEWSRAPNPKDPSQTNTERFDLDPEKVSEHKRRANDTIDKIQDEALFRKQAREFALEGSVEAGKVAMRQVVGLILGDLVKGISEDVRAIARHGVQDVAYIKATLSLRVDKSLATVKEKWGSYLQDGVFAGLAGLLSGLITLIVNSFITTAKRIVTIIREATLALVRAAKLVLMPEPGMTSADIAQAVLKILAGAGMVIVGLTVQEFVQKAIETVVFLAPFADTIASVITGMLVGLGSLLILFAFDHLKGILAFQNKQLGDVHRGQSVTLLRLKKTAFLQDQSRALLTDSYAQLQKNHADREADVKRARSASDTSLALLDRSIDGLDDILKGIRP